MEQRSCERLALSREIVFDDYNSAIKKNKDLYLEGDVKASSEFIYPNQKEDGAIITNIFYTTPVRAISIVKRTKVGFDGLSIELAKNMATHSDDNFVIHRNNVFIFTAMSNVSWETDFKDKIPTCFKPNVCHHGKLQKMPSKIKNIKNAVFIIDEIDSGDKEEQKLHVILKESGILDIKYMEENNIRFVFVSATIINELIDLYKWGDKHYIHYMIIPASYIGHKEFLEMGIIQEYYPINNNISAERWIEEDILQNYGSDYRVHIIRTDKKNIDYIHNACIKNNIDFKNHTSTDRISNEELSYIFDNDIRKHTVMAIKGFYRRANLIPNKWKLKIGATHERHSKKYDTNVQVQGLPGRMSGCWKEDILNGHKTGPHRTSIDAINEYEDFYKNPLKKDITYNTSGCKKLFVNPRNINNLQITIVPINIENKRVPIIITGLNITDIIFTTNKKSEKLQYIYSKLNNDTYEKLYNFIRNETCVCYQMTRPLTDNSYKKHITDVVHASVNNTPYSVDLKKKDSHINNWQVFIDNREMRLCFVIWSVDDLLY